VACVSIGGFAAVAFVRFTRDLPTVDQLVAYQPPAVTRVLAADGALIGELYTERRYPVPLDRVPLHVRRAFLAAEDAHFYEHAGVDVRGVARAAMVNLQRKGVAQGGSTITQQLVKMLLLSPERSWQRKAKEMYLAIRLELATTKDDILRLYLNQVYLGRGAYGVQAAAQRFFGVDVQDLSTAQAALLAGLVQAPGRYNPERRPDQARARQAWVLERMLLEDFITPDEYAAAVQEPLVLAPRHPAAAPSEAPWYLDHVRRILDRYYGNAAAELGLTVHTAVDLGMQRMAEESLRGGLRDVGHRQPFRGALRRADDAEIAAWAAGKAPACRPDGRCEAVVEKVRQSGLTLRTVAGPGTLGSAALVWHGEPLPTWRFRRGDVVLVRPLDDGALALDDEPGVEGALVAFEPSSGQVKALVGGYAYERSQFNRATQARRQPGSAFKPLLYAAALDHGFTPASRILDAPVTFGKGRAAWSPQNFGGKYYGRTNLRDALTKSLNTVSVRLLDKVGVTPVIDYLGRFGLHDDLEPNLSLALGTAEVTLLDLVRAYGVFASGGQRVEPLFITKVENLAGDDVPFPGTQGEMRYPAIDPAVAYVMTSMLESVVTRGTARRALELGRPAAGKTGTTNDSKDAWFVGYTPELLTGVWVGFDAGTPLGEKETGGRAATPIWTTFMQQALADRPIADFTIPEGVTFVDIEPWSGLRAVAGSSSRREVFVTGTEPTGFARRPEPEPTPEPEAPLYVDAIHPTAAVP
jgi:penicillin-binding protein 1A